MILYFQCWHQIIFMKMDKDVLDIVRKILLLILYKADALVDKTIYEFYGDYWHGNPARYAPNKMNKVSNVAMKYLFQKTLKREAKLKSLGYHLIYIWESDYDAGLDQSTHHPTPLQLAS